MESESDNRSETDERYIDESVSFPHVTAVVCGWTLDFLFLSLCRQFKEGKLEEFNETLSTFEAICENPSLKRERHNEKITICAFLARVMHGKHLDVQFDKNVRMMPLMSAAKVWSDLKDNVSDESLYKNVAILLLVQSVAVCLEKGQTSSASSALKWFENNHEFPKNLGVKLSTIVTKAETYHPFLMSFSFSHLMETVHSFLEAYLEENPSDYLFRAATKVVQSSQDMGGAEDSEETQNSSLSTKTTNKSTVDQKTKRKLLSTKITDVWKPDSCKKPFVAVKRISENDVSLVTSVLSDTPKNEKKKKPRKPRQSTRGDDKTAASTAEDSTGSDEEDVDFRLALSSDSYSNTLESGEEETASQGSKSQELANPLVFRTNVDGLVEAFIELLLLVGLCRSWGEVTTSFANPDPHPPPKPTSAPALGTAPIMPSSRREALQFRHHFLPVWWSCLQEPSESKMDIPDGQMAQGWC